MNMYMKVVFNITILFGGSMCHGMDKELDKQKQKVLEQKSLDSFVKNVYKDLDTIIALAEDKKNLKEYQSIKSLVDTAREILEYRHDKMINLHSNLLEKIKVFKKIAKRIERDKLKPMLDEVNELANLLDEEAQLLKSSEKYVNYGTIIAPDGDKKGLKLYQSMKPSMDKKTQKIIESRHNEMVEGLADLPEKIKTIKEKLMKLEQDDLKPLFDEKAELGSLLKQIEKKDK